MSRAFELVLPGNFPRSVRVNDIAYAESMAQAIKTASPTTLKILAATCNIRSSAGVLFIFFTERRALARRVSDVDQKRLVRLGWLV